MYDIGAAAFRNRCNIEIASDPKTGKDRQICVSCEIKMPNGKMVKFQKCMNLEPIINAITRKLVEMHREMHGEDVAVEGLGDFYRKASRVARNVAESKTVKALRKHVVKVAPYIAEAAELMPYGDKAVQVAQKAHGLLVKARQGSQPALDSVKRIAALAAAGDEKAAQVMEALRLMNEKLAEKAQTANVSGWLYNKPYRGNLAALSGDKTNPFHVLRGAYSKGML